MPSVSANKRLPSAEMSLSTLPMQRYDRRNEARFLQQQADDAKMAIKQTLARMRETSQDAADIRWWTQHYPWYAVGSAGLAGFVAATSLPTSSCGQERPAQQTHAEAGAQSSVFSGVFASLMAIARNVIMRAIIEALQPPDQAPATEHRPSAAPASYSEQ